jgi:hypothetical protein
MSASRSFFEPGVSTVECHDRPHTPVAAVPMPFIMGVPLSGPHSCMLLASPNSLNCFTQLIWSAP